MYRSTAKNVVLYTHHHKEKGDIRMGFFDDFKEALQGSKDITLPTHEQNPTQPQQHLAEDPASPFNITVKNEQPIEVKDPVSGDIVKFNILANGRAKLKNPDQGASGDYKTIAKDTVLETAISLLNNPSFLPDAHNVKALLLLSNKMIGPVTEAMNTKGFDVAFKMFNVTLAREV